MRHTLWFFQILFLFFVKQVRAEELLTQKDVHNVMENLVSKTPEWDKVSGEILKKSLRIYLEQFDVQRRYLLEGEVKPYFSPSEQDTKVLLQDYRKGNFQIYERMGELIRKAILRERQMRIVMREEIKRMAERKNALPPLPSGATPSGEVPFFLSSLEELQKRNFRFAIEFLSYYADKYGEAATLRQLSLLLEEYEKSMRLQEDKYLYVNEENRPLSEEQKAHLSTVHILKALAASLDPHTQFLTEQETYDTNVRLNLGQSGSRAVLQHVKDRIQVSTRNVGRGMIGIIRLDAFYRASPDISSAGDVKKAIAQLKTQGNLLGLILDLRENSGGYVMQAVKVAGLFMTKGVVVVSRYFGGQEQFFRDMEDDHIFDGPLVILTSRVTASAAEIVAGALQDYGVAVIVGDDRTYGKGTIQVETSTGNKATSHFKVTVGEYYTVSGKTPQVKGVRADIIVPGEYSRQNIGEEFLENHLDTQFSDSIPPLYEDPLSDVPLQAKGYYMKYYLPTLQVRTEKWHKMLPLLQKNSQLRLSRNKDYQLFVEGKRTSFPEDMQLEEGVSILKDMIMMQQDDKRNFVGAVQKKV